MVAVAVADTVTTEELEADPSCMSRTLDCLCCIVLLVVSPLLIVIFIIDEIAIRLGIVVEFGNYDQKKNLSPQVPFQDQHLV